VSAKAPALDADQVSMSEASTTSNCSLEFAM
jgi:hypothetical protein